MKDGLENSFKEALNNFELPYDAQAWVSLNKKLSAKKWYQATQIKWSAAFIIAIGIATYFILPTSNTHALKETENKPSTKETNSPISVKNDQTINSPSTKQHFVDQTTNSKGIDPVISTGYTPPVVVTELVPHSIPLSLDQMEVLGLTDKGIDESLPTPPYNRSLVEIDFKNRCQGETLQLEENKNYERLINYAGKEFHYTYNEPISLKLSEPGKVVLLANSGPYGQFEEFGSFDVNPSPVLSMNTDRTITYEDGLPKITCQAESNESQISWHSTYVLNSTSGKNVEVFAFDKGYAIVEAQVKASNGCIAKEKEMIQIPSDYNLLAVNAFNPQSQDSRNSTFMPYALTIRQTPFRLIVLDPDNGGIVFETTDANNAWDGIDRRDGKLVPGNKAYIWKVVIQRPVQGEKGEYRGTIVRM
ncbi:MAG: hypothetical protein RIS20_933 [Bacteroidota bacterium]|jgi:hypothetical protein